MVADTQARLEPFGAGPFGLSMYDSFLRRAWHVAERMKPDMVIFLGDMLSPGVTVARERYVDGSRGVDCPHLTNDGRYHEYFAKHKNLFATNSVAFYVPGNNDVGCVLPAIT